MAAERTPAHGVEMHEREYPQVRKGQYRPCPVAADPLRPSKPSQRLNCPSEWGFKEFIPWDS